MKTLGTFYSLRGAAEKLGGTDSRTVHLEIARHRIPTGTVGRAIIIDKAGFERLTSIYEAKRSKQTAGAA